MGHIRRSHGVEGIYTDDLAQLSAVIDAAAESCGQGPGEKLDPIGYLCSGVGPARDATGEGRLRRRDRMSTVASVISEEKLVDGDAVWGSEGEAWDVGRGREHHAERLLWSEFGELRDRVRTSRPESGPKGSQRSDA